jgi:hypothetical protein
MKFLLKENQLNDLRRTLSHSIEDYGIYETLKRYNLNLKSLSAIFKGEKLPEITCDDLYGIIYHHENFRRDLNNNVKTYKNYRFNFGFDEMGGSLFFSCKELGNPYYDDSLTGYATPYWDGNCYLPIDFDYYIWTDSFGNQNDEEISGEYYYSEEVPTQFDSFNEIYKWINNDYLKILSEKCEEVFNYKRG